MAESDDQGWEYGQVLPLRQRPIPYAGALRPELAMPEMAQSLANSLGGMLTIPGQVASGQMAPSAEAALQFTSGMMNAGLGGSSVVGVPRGAMGQFAGIRMPEGLPMKGGKPFMPEGWTPPTRYPEAPTMRPGESLADSRVSGANKFRGISDEAAIEAAKHEGHLGEADKELTRKMAEGQWAGVKGMPKRLPDWIKSPKDLEMYQNELVEHSKQTNEAMRSLGIEAANNGHKLTPVIGVPQFLAEGGA